MQYVCWDTAYCAQMQLRYASPPALSEHFEGHAKLEAVIYPGLPGHPGHEIARRQLDGGFGGMLSLACDIDLFQHNIY